MNLTDEYFSKLKNLLFRFEMMILMIIFLVEVVRTSF